MKKLFRFPLYFSFISLIFLAFSAPARAQTVVCLDTTLGDICLELLEAQAPDTAQNFLAYVAQGSYHNSFFHVSAKNGPVYVQAGRYTDTGSGTLEGLVEISRNTPIGQESSIANTRGTVAMVPDSAGNPDSVTSQLLINVEDNPSLDGAGYTVFARVTDDSMAVVDALADLPTIALDNDGLSQVPVLEQSVPVINSPRVMIFNAAISDDSGTDTSTPGEGETLYEDAVCVDTNVGEFCMQLYPEVAPATVTNFLNYVTSGRYDNTIIHRSVPDFVIQGGGYKTDPLGESVSKDNAVINEFGRSNRRGTVAMARLGGVVNSATSEWFVNLIDNTQLDFVDEGFTVFGEIISGMDIVDKIGSLPRLDLTSSLGGAFGEVPRSRTIGSEGVVLEDLVLVNRVYVTDVITDGSTGGGSDSGSGDGGTDGGNDGEVTTATYSLTGHSMSFPVIIGDELYKVSMYQDLDAPAIVFSVDTTRIYTLVNTGQDAATMDLDSGFLVIPSVKVGNKVITDVTFSLTEFSTLTFTLESYTRP